MSRQITREEWLARQAAGQFNQQAVEVEEECIVSDSSNVVQMFPAPTAPTAPAAPVAPKPIVNNPASLVRKPPSAVKFGMGSSLNRKGAIEAQRNREAFNYEAHQTYSSLFYGGRDLHYWSAYDFRKDHATGEFINKEAEAIRKANFQIALKAGELHGYGVGVGQTMADSMTYTRFRNEQGEYDNNRLDWDAVNEYLRKKHMDEYDCEFAIRGYLPTQLKSGTITVHNSEWQLAIRKIVQYFLEQYDDILVDEDSNVDPYEQVKAALINRNNEALAKRNNKRNQEQVEAEPDKSRMTPVQVNTTEVAGNGMGKLISEEDIEHFNQLKDMVEMSDEQRQMHLADQEVAKQSGEWKEVKKQTTRLFNKLKTVDARALVETQQAVMAMKCYNAMLVKHGDVATEAVLVEYLRERFDSVFGVLNALDKPAEVAESVPQQPIKVVEFGGESAPF